MVGLTGQEIEALLAQRLGERYLVDPQVCVFIEEFISQRVTVEGRVNTPGSILPTTLLQVIAMSQGIEELADTERIQLFRAGAGGKKQALFLQHRGHSQGRGPGPGHQGRYHHRLRRRRRGLHSWAR